MAAEQVLFEKDGVTVTREGPYRILKLGDVEQSRCDERQPALLFHEYTRVQLLGLLYVPEPRHVLIVGLGGASLTRALEEALPDTCLDNAEIDPAVVEAARRFFFYREGPRMRTILQDARAYLRDTSETYDLIFLDAFDGDEIPRPLRTREFYQIVRNRLAPGGAVVANFIRRSPLYDRDRATLASVFPYTRAYPGLGNVLVVGAREDRPVTREQAVALARRFGGAYPLATYYDERELSPDWDPTAEPLTDGHRKE